MLDFDHLQQELSPVLQAGNICLAVRTYIKSLKTASRADKQCIYTELRRIIEIHGGGFSRSELANILGALTSVMETDLEENKKDSLAELQRLVPVAYGKEIGVAQVLLASTVPFRGRIFGVVQQLHVSTYNWGGRKILHQPRYSSDGEGERELQSAGHGFGEGAQAAIRYLQSKIQGIDATIYLDAHSVEGSLPQLRCPVEGNSLGLGGAVATISALLQIPVPQNFAFTGFVERHGKVKEVGGLEAKLEAATEKDLEVIFVPANVPFEKMSHGSRIELVSDISQVVEKVFLAGDFKAASDRLRAARVPSELRRRSWRAVPGNPENAVRVLVTCVGGRDPFGPIARTSESIVRHEDGPVLTVAREIKPHRIYLFFTVRPDEDPSNDFSKNANELVDILKHDDPGCDVIPVPLKNVVDPTDFEQLFPAFEEELIKIVQANPEPAMFFVNVSSGTPQIQVTWHMAVERNLIPGGIRLQIREGRFAEKKKESRVRRVELPAW